MDKEDIPLRIKYLGFWVDEEGIPDPKDCDFLTAEERNVRNHYQRMRLLDKNYDPDEITITHLQNLVLLRNRKSRLLKSGFQIFCHFTNFRPTIYRRFVVPASIFLFDLNDRVLSPLFGFCRHYHAHYFKKLPYDKTRTYDRGICYGPKDMNGIENNYVILQQKCSIFQRLTPLFNTPKVDLMHIGDFGMEMVEGKEVMLGDVLEKVGDKMEWVYDIGDHYQFCLKLEMIIRPCRKKPDFQDIYLVDGAGCNLPENGDGNWGLAEYFFEVHKAQTEGDDEKVKQLQRERTRYGRSCNYSLNNMLFPISPTSFKLSRCKFILQWTISRTERVPDVKKNWEDIKMLMKEKDTVGSRPWNSPVMILPMSPQEHKRIKKSLKFCGNCSKKKKKLKVCANCLITYYCSRDCQMRDWKTHKLFCRKLKT